MKKLKFLPIFLIVLAISSLILSPAALALEPPAITSPTVIILDRESGEVLFEQNADQRVYPASVTKIMTVLLAVEAIDDGRVSLTDEVTASANITFDLLADGSSAGISVGETLSLESLLYAAMLSSANEACNIIAEHVGGSISNFVSMMNARAAELGCNGTNFTNTHGLPDDNHYTTARDFGLIGLAAAEHDFFMQLCSTPTYTMPASNLRGEQQLKNSNALINDSGIYGPNYLYEYANGVKTGHTSAAGYCLVSTAEKDGIKLLSAVFGGTESWAGNVVSYSNFADSISMYEWVFNNFSYREVLRSTDAVASVPVEMGSNADSVNLRPESSITALLPNDSDFSEFSLSVKYNHEATGETLVAPITAGDVLGEVTLSKNGVNYGTVNLVAAAGVDLSRSEYIKSEIAKTTDSTLFKVIVAVLVVIVVGYVALVVIYRVRRIRHKRAMRQARLERARQQREAQAKGASVPSAPAVSYFKDVNVTEVPEKTVRDMNAENAERDYFEEFFK